MGRRRYSSRFQCGAEGCKECVNYTSETRRDYDALWKQLGNGVWRCVRHTWPDDVLSADNPTRCREMIATRKFTERGTDIGLFWGNGSGFVYGPGFKAFCEDFPEGTILHITAEIVLPTPPTGASNAE